MIGLWNGRDNLTNMKTHSNNIQPQFPSPGKQYLRGIQVRTKFIRETNQRPVIVRIDPEQQFGGRHMCFDTVQLIKIVERGVRHPDLSREDKRRSWFAWVREDDASRVDAQI